MESEYYLWPQRWILVKRWKKLFSGVEVGFFFLDLRSFLSSEVRKFTERINQSRQKGLCGRTRRLRGGNKPNCSSALTNELDKEAEDGEEENLCLSSWLLSGSTQRRTGSSWGDAAASCEGATSDARRAHEAGTHVNVTFSERGRKSGHGRLSFNIWSNEEKGSYTKLLRDARLSCCWGGCCWETAGCCCQALMFPGTSPGGVNVWSAVRSALVSW